MITLRMEVNRRRLTHQVSVCQSGFERTRGLLLRRRLRPDEAMRIPQCAAIHTVGLWYRLDLAFCTSDGTILETIRNLPPCRVARNGEAAEVWEMPAGTVERLDLHPGDRLTAG